jgi:hypothetical protein
MAIITRLYDTREDAVATVTALEQVGMGHDEISFVGNDQADVHDANGATPATEPEGKALGAGATAGTIIGGGVGLMTGIGAMAIPGVGPVVAAGWLVSTLAGAGVGAAVGAGTGGLVGALSGEGVPEQDAHVYAEGVRRGGYLVTARVDDRRVSEAQRILSSRGVDVAHRRGVYEQEGWSRFDETAAPYRSTVSTPPTV